MEVPGLSSGGSSARALRLLVAGSFLTLALLLVVLFAHAATSNGAIVFAAEALSGLLVVLTVASMVAGVSYSWRAFPAHRRAITFVVAITLVTLLAHSYIIGSPPVSKEGSVSGPLGSTFADDRISINSAVTGQIATVTVTSTGGSAIAGLSLAGTNATLSGNGFAAYPTFDRPLQPGSRTTGTWTLSSSGTSPTIKVSYQYLACYATDSKSYGCIMDEVFYVPEAMGILAGQHCSTTTSDCHMEHPFLVPALLAAGMAVFGQYNVVGWRVMPVLLGTFSIPLLFGIAWKVSGNKRIAYLSAALLALDVMFFSQSSGGLLDVPETFFGLAAFFVYFAGLRVWRLDRYVLAGILLGAAGLAKETAVFIALGFLTYVLFFGEGRRAFRVYSVFKVTIVVGLVFAAGLQAYDSTLATPAVPTFVHHVSYILSYGSSLIAGKLACTPTTGYWCKFSNDPGGPPILPTDWLVYYSPVVYYAEYVRVCPNTVNGACRGGQYTYPSISFYGVTNLLETWTVFVWVPLGAYALWRHFRGPRPSLAGPGFEGGAGTQGMGGDLRLAALALVMFFWSYVPYLFIFLTGRVTYPFYFVPAIPAVALGAGYWVTRAWFSKWLAVLYVGMVFVFFFVYFPEKSFLPDWLRVLIGH